MDKRTELHARLVSILGSKYVYFQPPESIKLGYPCIIYKRSKIHSVWADNKNYLQQHQYQLTVIELDPDSAIPVTILSSLESCSHSRQYTKDGLNHNIFDLYY